MRFELNMDGGEPPGRSWRLKSSTKYCHSLVLWSGGMAYMRRRLRPVRWEMVAAVWWVKRTHGLCGKRKRGENMVSYEAGWDISKSIITDALNGSRRVSVPLGDPAW